MTHLARYILYFSCIIYNPESLDTRDTLGFIQASFASLEVGAGQSRRSRRKRAIPIVKGRMAALLPASSASPLSPAHQPTSESLQQELNLGHDLSKLSCLPNVDWLASALSPNLPGPPQYYLSTADETSAPESPSPAAYLFSATGASSECAPPTRKPSNSPINAV